MSEIEDSFARGADSRTGFVSVRAFIYCRSELTGGIDAGSALG